MGKRSGGTRGTNSSNSSKSRKGANGGLSDTIDSISITLFGNTRAVSVDNVFHNRYESKVAEEIRNSVGFRSVFSKPVGEIENVSVKNVYPTQQYMGAENLKNLSSIKMNDTDVPLGVMRKDRVYIIDGHHRAAIDIMKHKKEIKIRLIK